MPKVSVIVPVYNAEKTIERCVRSLLSQTLQDIEIIFVDDCSTDNSYKKLQELTENDNRCILMRNNKNEGPAKSRQKGLEAASADYFICCDSDDWAESTWIENLYNKAISEKADITWCDFDKNDGSSWKTIQQKPAQDTTHIDRNEEITALMLNKRQGSLWNHLIKRKMLKNVYVWPNSRMAEDFALLIQFYIASNVLSYIPLSLYHYDYNEQSLSNVAANQSDKKLISQAKELAASGSVVEQILTRHSLNEIFKEEIIFRKFFAKRWLLPALHTAADCRKIWRPLHSDINIKLFTCKYISASDKITALLCLFGIYPALRKLIRKR